MSDTESTDELSDQELGVQPDDVVIHRVSRNTLKASRKRKSPERPKRTSDGTTSTPSPHKSNPVTPTTSPKQPKNEPGADPNTAAPTPRPPTNKQQIFRVLLTGGPCGGKSSALATLNDELTRRGLHTIIVPESATFIMQNSGGFDPSWSGNQGLVAIQKVMLSNQIHMEETFQEVAKLRPNRTTVILHDRGCLDGKAFCSEDQWADVVRQYNEDNAAKYGAMSPRARHVLTDKSMIARYDLVLHLTTTADGAEEHYEFGPGSKNPSRFHAPNEAREADALFKEIYTAHPRRFVIPNFAEWDSKVRRILWHLSDFLDYGAAFNMLQGELIVKEIDDAALLAALPSGPGGDFRCFEYLITYLDESRTRHVKLRRAVDPSKKFQRQQGSASKAFSAAGSDTDTNFALQCEYITFAPKLVRNSPTKPKASSRPSNSPSPQKLRHGSGGKSSATCRRLISFAEYEGMIHSAGRLCQSPDLLKRSFCFFLKSDAAKSKDLSEGEVVGNKHPYFELCQYYKPRTPPPKNCSSQSFENDASFSDFEQCIDGSESIWSKFTINCFPGQMRLKISHAALDHKRRIVRIPSWCQTLAGNTLNQDFVHKARMDADTSESQDVHFDSIEATQLYREVPLDRVQTAPLRATTTMVAGAAR